MYLRVFNRPKGQYLVIYEKYYDKNKKMSKEKSVKTIGYVSAYKDLYKDPITHFQQVAADMSEDKKTKQNNVMTYNSAEEMEVGTDDSKNAGYAIIKMIYKELELNKFWTKVTSKMDIQFDADKIFQMLLYSRILFPASKKKSFEQKQIFFEDFKDFSLDDVYRALDIFAAHETDLQAWIYDHSVTKYNRDLSTGYFDCTNYYYDISKPDIDDRDEQGNLKLKRYRKYGPEKNHRKDPIVEMGLLMDKTGIPLAYDLFPGNESEKLQLLPILNKARNRYGFGRMIVVADRGLNTSDNIFKLNGKNDKDDNPRDGYVYGQTVRGADAEFKSWVLEQDGYIKDRIKDSGCEDMDDAGFFIHKSRIYPKKIAITREKDNGKKVKQYIFVEQRQMVYYSHKYAVKQKLERDRTVERAQDLIDHPKKYDKVSAKGASGYVMNLSFSKESGEIIAKNLMLDIEKIKEEEKYDGYYSIVSSELKLTDAEIREIYRGLIHIEDTFKLTKSEFDTRPIFVRTNEHIDAHFTVCFTAIVIIRLLEMRLGNHYPVGQILNSLRKYSCMHLSGSDYKFVYYDEIIKACGESFNVKLNYKYSSREKMRRLLKY